MRHFISTGILVCAGFALNAGAADTSSNPCTLLDWQDIQSLGVVQDTPMTDAGWHQEQTPRELPNSKLYTNMCAATIMSKAGRASVSLSFDSFTGKVTEQQVADWLKSAAPKEPEEGVSVVTVGEATCESGTYELPTKQDDDSVAEVQEHYVACDRQVGIQHVSLNIHVPEGDKARLFSPEQAKSLLDKAVTKMKEIDFAPPENRI